MDGHCRSHSSPKGTSTGRTTPSPKEVTGRGRPVYVPNNFLADFSNESLQLSQWGKRWAVQLPQLALWTGPGGDAALFESRFPPFAKGGLRGQGVRWSVPTSIPGPTLRRVPRECPLPIPTNPLSPPCTTPISPADPLVVNAVPPKAGLLVASLPVAKSQRTSPHRPAPSAKAGASEALQPLRLHG